MAYMQTSHSTVTAMAMRLVSAGSVRFVLRFFTRHLQLITGFYDGLDTFGVFAQLLAKALDVGIYRPDIAVIIIAPALYQKLFPGQDHVSVF
jgi:hypothetical protein